jgi:hypothetical protein
MPSLHPETIPVYDSEADLTEVTLGTLLNIMIGALEEHGIDPLPGTVGAAGFTILVSGHRVRIGFGCTMS